MLKPFLPCSSSTIVESIDIHTPSQLSHPSSPPASQLYPSSVIKHKPHAQSYTNLMTLASFGSPNRIELNH